MKYGINILLVFVEQWMLERNSNVYEMPLGCLGFNLILCSVIIQVLFSTPTSLLSQRPSRLLCYLSLHITLHTHWYLHDTHQQDWRGSTWNPALFPKPAPQANSVGFTQLSPPPHWFYLGVEERISTVHPPDCFEDKKLRQCQDGAEFLGKKNYRKQRDINIIIMLTMSLEI